MAPRNKQQVARQFSRAAASYDQAAHIQQQAMNQTLNQLKHIHGHWADIGCGTGAAIPGLIQQGANRVTGIDLSEGMLSYAKQQHHGAAEFILADADSIPLANQSLEGIFSSLMLQWSEDLAHTLKEWNRLLKPTGTLAFATLISGTQKELKQAWQAIDNAPHVNEFLSENEVLQRLSESGFSITQTTSSCLQESFNSMPTLLRHLKDIGATNVNPGRRQGLGGRNALKKLEESYPRADPNAPYVLSYELLWVWAKKENTSHL